MPALKAWCLPEGDLLLQYRDGTRFIINNQGTEVSVIPPAHYTDEDFSTYIVGPILGILLRMRGILCIHASVVELEGGAVAFVGPASAGKSTTAAAFAQRGFPVLSDDVLAIDPDLSEVRARPGYPRVNVWPDAVNGLFGDPERLPRIAPSWEKRYLDLAGSGYRFCDRITPLSRIYFLTDSQPEPQIETVQPQSALTQLLANSYVGYLLDRGMRVLQFNQAARVIDSVPTARLACSSAVDRLHQTVDLIVKHAGNSAAAV